MVRGFEMQDVELFESLAIIFERSSIFLIMIEICTSKRTMWTWQHSRVGSGASSPATLDSLQQEVESAQAFLLMWR